MISLETKKNKEKYTKYKNIMIANNKKLLPRKEFYALDKSFINFNVKGIEDLLLKNVINKKERLYTPEKKYSFGDVADYIIYRRILVPHKLYEEYKYNNLFDNNIISEKDFIKLYLVHGHAKEEMSIDSIKDSYLFGNKPITQEDPLVDWKLETSKEEMIQTLLNHADSDKEYGFKDEMEVYDEIIAAMTDSNILKYNKYLIWLETYKK